MSVAPRKPALSKSRVSAKPQGILVLGMHRSGTSACTRVLNLLGCALPADLIQADYGNEAGHWESAAAVTLNDEMLASAGTSWEDWGPLNEDWRQSPVRSEMVNRVMAVVQEHERLGSLFVLKDPRLCRVADVWLEAMSESGVEPLALLMLRNPAEVTASLENRDLMAPGYGQLLWLRHVLDAEYYSRGQKRVVCRYDQLMTNWPDMIERVKAGLGIPLPRNSPSVHAEIDQFLSVQHRHHVASPETIIANPGLSIWLKRTFAIMLAWSEKGEDPADHLELDEIRLQFDRSYSTFARLLMPGGFSGEFGSGSRLKEELANTLAQAQHATSELQIGTAQTEAKLAEAAAREAELEAQIDAGYSRFQELQNQLEAFRAQTAQLGSVAAQTDTLRAREAELIAQIDFGDARSKELQTEIEAFRAETQSLRATAEQADALRAREAELLAKIETGDARSRGLQAEIEALRSETQSLGTIAALASAMSSREVELVAQIEAGDARSKELYAEIEALSVETLKLGAIAAQADALRTREAELLAKIEIGDARSQDLQAEIEAQRAEFQRLGAIAAQSDALRAREAELLAKIEIGDVRFEELQAEIEALRAETQRLGIIAAQAIALRARKAELEARIETSDTRSKELQAEIEALRAENLRLGTIAVQAAELRAREVEFSATVAELQSANMQAKVQVEVEQKQRLEAEQKLIASTEKLYDQQLRNAELSGGFAAAESALVQRQEELSQLWAQLLAAENSLTLSKVNEKQERDQRIAAEQRIAAATNDIADLQSRLDQARATLALQTDRMSSEIEQLTRMLQGEEAANIAARAAEAQERDQRIAAEQRIAASTNDIADLQSRLDQAEAASAVQTDRLSSEIAQIIGMLRDQEIATHLAIADREATSQALAERTRETGQLSASLQQQEAATRVADTARAAAEHKLALRFDEVARLTAMLADEAGKAGQAGSNADWLREVARISEGFPKWWALMPKGWRRKRELARYEGHRLFDARQYLETYPDVALFGMDPIRHYILHGMAEGRKRPR